MHSYAEGSVHAYHVWAEGNLPAIGACDMVNLGFRAQKPSDGNCDDPVVNCSSLYEKTKDYIYTTVNTVSSFV